MAAKGEDAPVRVAFALSFEDGRRLAEFQAEHGFTTLNLAAKALMIAAITSWPTWGLTKAFSDQAREEIRTRFLVGMASALMKLHAEVVAELPASLPPPLPENT